MWRISVHWHLFHGLVSDALIGTGNICAKPTQVVLYHGAQDRRGDKPQKAPGRTKNIKYLFVPERLVKKLF